METCKHHLFNGFFTGEIDRITLAWPLVLHHSQVLSIARGLIIDNIYVCHTYVWSFKYAPTVYSIN